MKTTRLRVVLCDVEPPLARVIDVPSKATLPELHDLLQAAIGWTNSHLHQFVTPEATYGMEFPGGDVLPEDQRDETAAQLADLGDRFEYLYDLGDGWAHDVEVLGPGGGTPGCVDGDGACPPEDCGGPGGYAELLDALADPRHPEHDEMRAWVGDRLRPFNLAATDRRVRRVAGEVPESVRLLLNLVGNGLKLTPGGRLPRTVVHRMQQHRPNWYPLDRPAAIEDDLQPLATLHDELRHVGLLRLRHGVLSRTRAAGDDLAIVRRLRTAFEPNTFGTVITELTLGVLAAAGPVTRAQLAERVHQLLGHGWQLDGQPVTEQDLRIAIGQQSTIMEALDLIDTSNRLAWTIGRSAQTLLPGAAMLADIWARDGVNGLAASKRPARLDDRRTSPDVR